MNTDRVRAAVVGLLGVLAVGATAASMDGASPTSSTGDGGGTGAGEGSGSGSTAGSGSGETVQTAPIEPSRDLLAPVTELFGALIVAGLAFLIAYAVYQYWRDGLAGLLVIFRISRDVVIALAFLGLLAALVLWRFYQEFEPFAGAEPEQIEPGSAGRTAVDAVSSSGGLDPVYVALAVGGVVLAGVAILVAVHRLNRGGSGDGTGTVDDEEADEADGRVDGAVDAGRGPSVADVEPSNGVYRAWLELATSVDREGVGTRTPAEVARRAVDAGLDSQAVDTITATFEEVRYGRRPATPDRESKARSALDRLDDTGGDGT